jgi:UDP-N-acetylmuramate dehydrogenase
MPMPPATVALLAPLEVRLHEPLYKKTWWRVGGPADGYVEVNTTAELQQVVRATSKTHCPLTILGNASNVLVSDLGIRGLVVRLTGELAEVTAASGGRPGEALLQIGAGVKLVGFMRKAPERGFTGLEMLAGIPGTMGGAVVMNAGTRLGEVSDVLHSVGVVRADGSVQILTREQLPMRYRHGGLPPDAVVAWAKVRLGPHTREQSQALIDEHLAYRADTQPVNVPTCGSTFRNPQGDSAGRLIEATKLKGRAIGGAMVSLKHANFIENTGAATADDIRRLIGHVQQQVWQAHKVLLEPEVQFLGDWSDWDPDETA